MVDTKLASIAEGLLIYEAIRQHQKGMTAAELADWASEALYYAHGYFMVSDLDSLHRGGRIPTLGRVCRLEARCEAVARVRARWVRLALVGVARGRKKGMKSLVEYFERNREADSEGGVVLTGNADCPKDVARLEDMLVKADEDLVLVDCNIGPVIGCHVGPDMIAVAFWGKDRRETVSVVDRIANKVKKNR